MSDDDSLGDFDISTYDSSQINTEQATKNATSFFSSPTGITIFVFIVLFFLIILFFKLSGGGDSVKGSLGQLSALKGRLADATKLDTGGSVMPLLAMSGMMFYYFFNAIYFKYSRGQWRSNKHDIRLLTQNKASELSGTLGRFAALSNKASYSTIDSLRNNNMYKTNIPEDHRALINWRPLTVRLAGYLGGGGQTPSMDGVFYMNQGITLALDRGARGFIFDIDYLDVAPCNPVILFRDDGNIMRSLNTGSIKIACQTLAQKAFLHNTDPVLIMIYMRRIPEFTNQRASYFKNIANALYELRNNFLKDADSQVYHSCTNEGGIFITPINKFESKFIIAMNLDTFDTSKYTPTSALQDNLHYYNNVRMYSDPQGLSVGLGSVITPPKTGIMPSIQVGHISQLLNLPKTAGSSGKSPLNQYQESARLTFKVVIGSPDYEITANELSILLNTNGANCVPLDVLNLAMTAEYKNTMDTALKKAPTLLNLSEIINPNDPLSAWAYNGWSLKKFAEGFVDAPVEAPIVPPPPGDLPVFVIPQPRKPNPPDPKTDAGGGLLKVV